METVLDKLLAEVAKKTQRALREGRKPNLLVYVDVPTHRELLRESPLRQPTEAFETVMGYPLYVVQAQGAKDCHHGFKVFEDDAEMAKEGK